MSRTRKNANSPFVYSNMPRRPPKTDMPASAELTPNVVPDDLAVEVEEELELVPVADPTPLLASAVVRQVYVPRMTCPPDLALDSLSKVVQSMFAVD